MTPQEARVILARMSYKPGYSFVLEGYDDMVTLKAPEQLNTIVGCAPVQLHFHTSAFDLSALSEIQFIAVVMKLVAGAERHELEEWLRLDGRTVYTPEHR